MAQLSMCARECRIAMRLSGVPPLPSRGALLGSTKVTRSSLRSAVSARGDEKEARSVSVRRASCRERTGRSPHTEARRARSSRGRESARGFASASRRGRRSGVPRGFVRGSLALRVGVGIVRNAYVALRPQRGDLVRQCRLVVGARRAQHPDGGEALSSVGSKARRRRATGHGGGAKRGRRGAAPRQSLWTTGLEDTRTSAQPRPACTPLTASGTPCLRATRRGM